MTILEGKQILMFFPYGATKHYGEAIKAELESRGALVKSYDERPSQNAISKSLIRYTKKKFPFIFERYIQSVIKRNNGVKIDYVLLCRAEAFTPLIINYLRNVYPGVKIILYLWDTLDSSPVQPIISCCDKAMSFDPMDVKENQNLQFRPTFFVDEYSHIVENLNPQNDVIFIGTLHTNRYKIIRFLEESLATQGLELIKYFFLPSILVYMRNFFVKFPYVSIKKVHFHPLSLVETIKLLNDTKVILDINHTGQVSLSTRAFEAMAAKRKYITTNHEVKKYDFYSTNNVLIIDLNNPIIPKDFFETPFKEVDASILRKYSVAGLVDDLFEFN